MTDRINPNDSVRVKLTEHGRRCMVRYIDNFNDHMRASHPNATYRASVPKLDDEGCLRDQFWSVMQYFEGEHRCGGNNCFEWMEKA